jgi:hypothetical protein
MYYKIIKYGILQKIISILILMGIIFIKKNTFFVVILKMAMPALNH